jgi:colicin import membrane protein
MDNNDLKVQVAKVVEDLFNAKEEAEIRQRTEAELQKAATSISDLTTALEDKNSELAEVTNKLSENETAMQELTSELEAAKSELEQANEKISETEKTLEDMRKDRASELRMAELEDAGVARSDRESQEAKVREMTDEDFASYKDELVSVRNAVVEELEKARQQAEADAQAEKDAAEEAAKAARDAAAAEAANAAEEAEDNADDSENASDNNEADDEGVPPAQVNPGNATMASLNLESVPSDDVMAKYRKMGEAMAKSWTKKDN